MPYNEERLELGLTRIDSYYDTHGWYFDGKGGMKDYYNGFASYFYSLLYAMTMQRMTLRGAKNSAPAPARLRRILSTGLMKTARRSLWPQPDLPLCTGGIFLALRGGRTAGVHAGHYQGHCHAHLDWWAVQPITDNGGVLTIATPTRI